MRLSLRILGLDLLDVEVDTDDRDEQRDSDVGIAATVQTDPPPDRMGFEDRKR